MTRLTSFLVLALLCTAASVSALTCGSATCPNGNLCCNDVLDGPRCYDAGQAVCASTGLPASSGSGSSQRLCGYNEAACNTTCYQTADYFCCGGILKQNGEACATAAVTSTPSLTPAPTTPAGPTPYFCASYGNTYGVNCSSADLCCGEGTIYPSCLPADGSKKCCRWFLGATQCDQDQVCGGSLGSGASSYAQCGPAGSTFCNRGLVTNTFCTAAAPVCCGLNSAYCCAPGCGCNYTAFPSTCSCPAAAATSAPTIAATVAPTTTAPTVKATVAPTVKATAAPTLSPTSAHHGHQPYFCASLQNVYGVNCTSKELCCGEGSLQPSCLPADGSKKCCTWYIGATQCKKNEVCGGSEGPGASSYAQCGPPGSTFCNGNDGENAFCTAAKPVCCASYGSFCCAPGCSCNTTTYPGSCAC